MLLLRRLLRVILLIGMTIFPLLNALNPSAWWPSLLFWTGLASYILMGIFPHWGHGTTATGRLRVMIGGYELFFTAGLFGVAECVVLPVLIYHLPPQEHSFVLGAVAAFWILIPLFLLLCNAFFRIVLTSTRLRLLWRVLLVLLWWVPLVNLLLFITVCHIVRQEYQFECAKLELDFQRQESEICKTKYPLVLVHGIFFRDWQLLNYWGRIPKVLIQNGAEIFYGGQQSAAAVAISAAELGDKLRAILAETGSEKVNIIAHSKGGLDSRYAISRLGFGDVVASLTTINTPHRGCVFAQQKLETMPKSLVAWISARYNSIFHKLGDPAPDFLAGINDLTADRCAAFNAETPDAPGVYYQSVTSHMKGFFSAPFPLNLTWLLVKRWDKEQNDGLVADSSARWGAFLGVLRGAKRRGISHGDVIDLMREDVDGFDVREYYVNLVKNLKSRGL